MAYNIPAQTLNAQATGQLAAKFLTILALKGISARVVGVLYGKMLSGDLMSGWAGRLAGFQMSEISGVIAVEIDTRSPGFSAVEPWRALQLKGLTLGWPVPKRHNPHIRFTSVETRRFGIATQLQLFSVVSLSCA